MRKLKLTRFKNVYDGTIGRLEVVENSQVIFSCFTLEPRGEDETTPNLVKRVPQGRYKLRLHNSPKFKRTLIHIYNDIVPKSRYILIHNGNYPKDTLGCILLGATYNDNGVFDSLKAFKEFMSIMLKSNVEDDILEIVNMC